MKSVRAKLRPLHKPGKPQHSSRIYVHKDTLVRLVGLLENGRPCVVETDEPKSRKEAVLWVSPDPNINRNVVQISPAFKEAGGFSFEDEVTISLVGKTAETEKIVNGGQALSKVQEIAADRPTRDKFLRIEEVEGLEEQVRQLNVELAQWNRTLRLPAHPRACGIMIDGASGTGKTTLCKQIAKSNWGTVYNIKHSEKLTAISETFKMAKGNQPSIIILDHFDKLIDKDRSNRGAVIETICEFLDELHDDSLEKDELTKVVVIGACRDYFTGLPDELRRIRRFTSHITLPMPSRKQRRAILTSWDTVLDPAHREAALETISRRTHAYSYEDLRMVVEEVAKRARAQTEPLGESEESQIKPVSLAAYDHVLKIIRPKLMFGVNLKPPSVRWADIGGQDTVKKALTNIVTHMREAEDSTREVMDKRNHGVLLYGPPGCSKTMVAQALATECDLNYFAVQGAELISMYVGESERELRNLFKRARAVAPSIIFFDEIDSIAPSRGGVGSSSSASRSGTGALNVVTTLLTEMQGFESDSGVLVLAATNRPDSLDPALLRPGRFDELIYVGPPNQQARESMLRRFLDGRVAAPEVDPAALALRMDGHSGVEIAAICQRVAKAVASQHRDEGTPEVVTTDHFEMAAKAQRKMITRKMLEDFRTWAMGLGMGALEIGT